jgi:hypothetical protein
MAPSITVVARLLLVDAVRDSRSPENRIQYTVR